MSVSTLAIALRRFVLSLVCVVCVCKHSVYVHEGICIRVQWCPHIGVEFGADSTQIYTHTIIVNELNASVWANKNVTSRMYYMVHKYMYVGLE